MLRSAHPPPETTSISLVLKIMAMLKQVRHLLDFDSRNETLFRAIIARYCCKNYRNSHKASTVKIRSFITNFSGKNSKFVERRLRFASLHSLSTFSLKSNNSDLPLSNSIKNSCNSLNFSGSSLPKVFPTSWRCWAEISKASERVHWQGG